MRIEEEAELCAVMHGKGFNPPSELKDDGQFHRFATGEGPNQNGWYYCRREGRDDKVLASFDCWKRQQSYHWQTGVSSAQFCVKQSKEVFRQGSTGARQNAGKEAQALTQQKAHTLWDTGEPVTQHSYLKLKGLPAVDGIKRQHGCLMIPLYDHDKTLWSIQFINAQGQKRFLKGGRKRGLFCTIGEMNTPQVYCVEGYATGVSVHLATQQAVVVAFDAGN